MWQTSKYDTSIREVKKKATVTPGITDWRAYHETKEDAIATNTSSLGRSKNLTLNAALTDAQ